MSDVWLWRSKSGKFVHTMECRHARRPWNWAVGKMAVEIMWSCWNKGIRECKQCKPFGGLL